MSKSRKPRQKWRKFGYIVCKPCWELKYCPYGPYVEHFPLFSKKPTIADNRKRIENVKRKYNALLNDFASGKFKTEEEILHWVTQLEYLWPERWEALADYDTSELECKNFGHICPVFFNKEPFTETKETRRMGRYIPRDIMLKVVRRDGQICQICHCNVPDTDLEFDHIIPFSKGGPISVENLRVACADCNGKKRDSLKELLNEKER